MKYWEIIADKLSKSGWSLGWVSAVDSNGRTIWITDAHHGDGKRFVVHADEKLTAFVELESAIRGGSPASCITSSYIFSQSRNRCYNCPADETSHMASHTNAGEK
jgi:hypothetical protein